MGCGGSTPANAETIQPLAQPRAAQKYATDDPLPTKNVATVTPQADPNHTDSRTPEVEPKKKHKSKEKEKEKTAPEEATPQPTITAKPEVKPIELTPIPSAVIRNSPKPATPISPAPARPTYDQLPSAAVSAPPPSSSAPSSEPYPCDCIHSSRIVVKPIVNSTLNSYTGGGATWGTIKSTVPFGSDDRSICEAIILAVNKEDGFTFGLSPLSMPVAALPGGRPNSIAWNPCKGTIVLNDGVLQQPTRIVLQPKDRITLSLQEGKFEIYLNAGLIATLTLSPQMKSVQLVPHVGLIGGSTLVWSAPTAPQDRSAMLATLTEGLDAHLVEVQSSAQAKTEVKRSIARLQSIQAVAVEQTQTKLAQEEDKESDPQLLAKKKELRQQLAQVSAEENERTLVRQVRLKLHALRALSCPTRQAVTMWRKCLRRAQERQNTPGYVRKASSTIGNKRASATKPISPTNAAVSTIGTNPLVSPANVVTSSFRTVPKTKNLSDHIFLDQYDGKLPGGLTSYEWIVRNEQLENLIIELNFSKCKGLDLHGPEIQQSVIKPYQHKLIAQVTQLSAKDGYSMSYSITCQTHPPDESDLKAIAQVDEDAIAKTREKMQEAGITVPDATQALITLPSSADQIQTRSHGSALHVKDHWSELISSLKTHQLPSFLDLSFPPVATSVWAPAPPPSSAVAKRTAGGLSKDLPLTWRRLFAFLPQGAVPTFFEPQIDPNDIQQGRLGNCWFCSSLSAVAETPELVTRLFGPKQKINVEGVYSIRLCISGVWSEVILDDYFPCYPSAGPIFTKNHGSQLWVLLIEKAFAKLYGSYDRLVSGQAHHALADLTGYPVQNHALDQAECAHLLANGGAKLWEECFEYARQDLSMCAGTIGKENATDATNALLKFVGLIAGHAYTMLSCMEIPKTASTSGGTRLLELRNPWGQGEWTGNWSDNSPLWTPELKALMKPKIDSDTEDGLFYMEFSDFLKYFSSVSTCFIRSPKERPWKETRFTGYFESTSGNDTNAALSGSVTHDMYSMVVTQTSDVWVVIYQLDTRLPNAPPFIDQGVMILKQTSDSSIEVVCDTKLFQQRQLNVTAHLEPGSYIVLPYTTGTRAATLQSPIRPYQLALFGDEASTISSIHPIPFSSQVYDSALTTLLRTSGTKDIFGKDQQLWLYQLRHGGSHLCGCGIDPSYTKHVSVTLDSSASVNAISHHGVNKSITRLLAPGALQLFHHLAPIEEAEATSYSVDIAFKTVKV